MYLLGISFRASHESLFNFVQLFNILFKFLLCDAMFFVESCVKLTYRLMFFLQFYAQRGVNVVLLSNAIQCYVVLCYLNFIFN